ncbi:PA3496 family putative envelope integrity protein [Neptuniibacter sp. QD72_48]|uniref:PA3496 family putative envelope integrity protein n=1 Tax=unclassified Neptuniibacter TaxID=2630693 RepID=UPI0039F6BAB6
MSHQGPINSESNQQTRSDESILEDELLAPEELSTIYKKESINPAKRRRLEAMREEKELQKDLREIFDDDDWKD